MRSIKVFLDDCRPVIKGWVLAKSAEECIELLKKGNVDVLSLDHDLGDEGTKTGYYVAQWIVEQQELHGVDLWPNEIFLHTSNPPGRASMYQLLTRYAPPKVIIHRTLYPRHFMEDVDNSQ